MQERLDEEMDRNSRYPIAFRFEIEACQPNRRRDKELTTLLGVTFPNENFSIKTVNQLFKSLKSKINESVVTEDDAPNIVKLNIIAKFLE